MKTTAHKKQLGTHRIRDIEKFQLQKSVLIREVPRPPAKFTGAQKALFKSACSIKVDNFTLVETDLPEIEMLCRLNSQRSELLKAIDEEGFIVTTDTGRTYITEYYKTLENIDRLYNAKLRLLALDTAALKAQDKANSKLSYNEPKEPEPTELDKLMTPQEPTKPVPITNTTVK